ncbi:MAG: sigma-70 family RNA polymerase sigma factor [Oscillospiraceae bacterium]|nr:sigma-70 family RNA polymerase sigma factor [Oscillospiraceae bacterium]
MPIGKPDGRLEHQREAAQDQLEALVERASKGDKDALCELCEKIAKGVMFKVTYILGKGSGVEDVSQEVLIRVCENIQNLRSPKAFKTWLSRIIVNEKNRYLAKNMKQGDMLNIDDHLEDTKEETGEFIPQEYVESKELRKKVMQAIEGLPMRQRETIMLHYYDGLSVTEIARVLDVTTQSVSKNLAVARGKLKEELGRGLQASGQMGAMVALPIGAVLEEVLKIESACFSAGEAYIHNFVSRCAQFSISDAVDMVRVFSAAPSVYGVLAGFCATAFTAATIACARNRPS